jgi:hypothetical protein
LEPYGGEVKRQQMRLLIEGEEWEQARMVSAILALFQTETIRMGEVEYHPRIVVEKVKEDDSLKNDESLKDETKKDEGKDIAEDIVAVTFNFIIFEQIDGESNPYLEKLRDQGEKIVRHLMMNGRQKKKVIVRPADNGQLELPI